MPTRRDQLRTGSDGHIRPLGDSSLSYGFHLLQGSEDGDGEDQDAEVVYSSAMQDEPLTGRDYRTLSAASDELARAESGELPTSSRDLIKAAADKGIVLPGSVLSYHPDYDPRS